MNEQNDCDHTTEVSMAGESIEKIICKEIVSAIKAMKPGKAAEPSKLCAEMISAGGEVEISVRMELCQYVLNGKGMPDEGQTNVLVPISKGKGDIRYCNVYRRVKVLEHAMKIIKRVLERI